MRVLSLFSGIGGFDLGLERAGMTVVGQVEIDPYCQRVLAKHWPDVKRMGDIHDVRGDEFGAVDLVCGGPPCQPVSSAGRRQGEDDARWLWPEMVRIILAIRPRYALMENPLGLFDKGRLGIPLGELAAGGYDAEWDCLPAAAFGAPHLRDRVWILAYPRLCDGGAQREQQQAPRAAIADSGSTGDVADSSSPRVGRLHLRPRRSRQAEGHAIGSGANVSDASIERRRTGRTRRSDSSGEGQREQALSALGNSASARRERPVGKGGTSAGRISPLTVGGCAGVADAHREPIFGTAIARGERDPWLVEPDVGRVAHGIPARVDRLRGLGNAVVPQIIEYIGRRIMAVEKGV